MADVNPELYSGFSMPVVSSPLKSLRTSAIYVLDSFISSLAKNVVDGTVE